MQEIQFYNFLKILKNYVTTQMNLINAKLVAVEDSFFYNIYQMSNFIIIEKEFFIKIKKFY
jgi:hypothetical protein